MPDIGNELLLVVGICFVRGGSDASVRIGYRSGPVKRLIACCRVACVVGYVQFDLCFQPLYPGDIEVEIASDIDQVADNPVGAELIFLYGTTPRFGMPRSITVS